MLLPSFSEKVLGIDDLSTKEFIESGDVYVTTQLKALGNKKDTWGLVDLVIGIGDTDMIIENKVNGVLSEGHTTGEYLDALEYSYQHLCELRQNSQRMKDDSAYTIENCARKYMDFFNR